MSQTGKLLVFAASLLEQQKNVLVSISWDQFFKVPRVVFWTIVFVFSFKIDSSRTVEEETDLKIFEIGKDIFSYFCK